jgi:arylsulfatase A-like enzyme
MIAANAIEQLRVLAVQPAPWFLAVGLHKPHLPHFAPKRYFDLYQLEDISLPRPSHVPANSSAVVFANGNGNHELWEYDDVAAGWPGQYSKEDVLLPVDEVRRQRRAYFATISFTDAQIGRVLGALDGVPSAADRTIIALFGDHVSNKL